MPLRPQPPTTHDPRPSPSRPSRPPTTAPPRLRTPNPRKRRRRRRRSSSPQPAPRRSASPRTAAPAPRASARAESTTTEPDYCGQGGQFVPVELAALGPFGVFFLAPREGGGELGGREGEGGGGEDVVVVEEEEEQEEWQEEGDELPDIVTGEINRPGFMVFVRERRAADGEVAKDLAEHRARHGKGSGWPFEE